MKRSLLIQNKKKTCAFSLDIVVEVNRLLRRGFSGHDAEVVVVVQADTSSSRRGLRRGRGQVEVVVVIEADLRLGLRRRKAEIVVVVDHGRGRRRGLRRRGCLRRSGCVGLPCGRRLLDHGAGLVLGGLLDDAFQEGLLREGVEHHGAVRGVGDAEVLQVAVVHVLEHVEVDLLVAEVLVVGLDAELGEEETHRVAAEGVRGAAGSRGGGGGCGARGRRRRRRRLRRWRRLSRRQHLDAGLRGKHVEGLLELRLGRRQHQRELPARGPRERALLGDDNIVLGLLVLDLAPFRVVAVQRLQALHERLAVLRAEYNIIVRRFHVHADGEAVRRRRRGCVERDHVHDLHAASEVARRLAHVDVAVAEHHVAVLDGVLARRQHARRLHPDLLDLLEPMHDGRVHVVELGEVLQRDVEERKLRARVLRGQTVVLRWATADGLESAVQEVVPVEKVRLVHGTQIPRVGGAFGCDVEAEQVAARLDGSHEVVHHDLALGLAHFGVGEGELVALDGDPLLREAQDALLLQEALILLRLVVGPDEYGGRHFCFLKRRV
eukprot:PhM_4_TR5249/c0_g1_i1/m.42270